MLLLVSRETQLEMCLLGWNLHMGANLSRTHSILFSKCHKPNLHHFLGRGAPSLLGTSGVGTHPLWNKFFLPTALAVAWVFRLTFSPSSSSPSHFQLFVSVRYRKRHGGRGSLAVYSILFSSQSHGPHLVDQKWVGPSTIWWKFSVSISIFVFSTMSARPASCKFHLRTSKIISPVTIQTGALEAAIFHCTMWK